MIDTSVQFHQRPCSTGDFAFVKQGEFPHCVFASIAGGVNQLTDFPFWTADCLANECIRQGMDTATFDSVLPIALQPCEETIEGRIYRDTDKKDADRFLGIVMDCLLKQGVPIISLELSTIKPPNVQRLAQYHMLTLLKAVPGGFDVWDTNGYTGQLTNEEVKEGFQYGDQYLVSHPDYECLLLKKKA